MLHYYNKCLFTPPPSTRENLRNGRTCFWFRFSETNYFDLQLIKYMDTYLSVKVPNFFRVRTLNSLMGPLKKKIKVQIVESIILNNFIGSISCRPWLSGNTCMAMKWYQKIKNLEREVNRYMYMFDFRVVNEQTCVWWVRRIWINLPIGKLIIFFT